MINSVQQKRELFRKQMRSQSINQIFLQKRKQLMESLKLNDNKQSFSKEIKRMNQMQIQQIIQLVEFGRFQMFNRILISRNKEFYLSQQVAIFKTIFTQNYIAINIKIQSLCHLINRKDFKTTHEIQKLFGFKQLIQLILMAIHQKTLYQSSINMSLIQDINKSYEVIQYSNNLKSLACLSLIKLWQIKPKAEYFGVIQKNYHIILQKVFNVFGFSLIVELTQDKLLMAPFSFIKKILKLHLCTIDEIKLYRVIQILKNFIANLKIQSNQNHPRQIIFEYVEWVKIQIDYINKESVQNQNSFAQNLDLTNQTRNCLISLLYATLNKLSELNSFEKQNYQNQNIIIKNFELLNHRPNQKLLQFLIQEENEYKQNTITLKTLCLLLGFLRGHEKIKSQYGFESQVSQMYNQRQSNAYNGQNDS